MLTVCSGTRTTGVWAVTAPSHDDAELNAETATIAFVDLVESVKHVVLDERLAVRHIRNLLSEVVAATGERYGSTLIERRGDGVLFRFVDASLALRAGLSVFDVCRRFNARNDCNFAFRIGVHTAELFVDGDAFYGIGINIAARVAALAKPNELYATAASVDQVVANVDARIEEIGDCYLKHIDAPVRVYRISEVERVIAPSRLTAEPLEMLRPAIAVLPFEVTAGDDGLRAATLLGETLVHTLARSENVRVTSWMSTRSLDPTRHSLADIAAALDVQWLIRGTVACSDGRVSGWCEVLDPKSKTPWSDRFSGDVGDLLARESEIASALCDAILHAIADAEARKVAKHALPTLKSHSLLVGAVGLMHRSSRENFSRGREALEHLVERHPRMHAVRPWLAQWYVLSTTRGYVLDAKRDAVEALGHTARALDSEPTDSFAMAMEGFVHCHLRKDLDRAGELLSRAVSINPNDSHAWLFQTTVLGAQLKHQEAWCAAQIALRLAPFDPQRHYYLSLAAGAAYFAGMSNEAIALAREAMKLNALHAHTLRILLYTLVEAEHLDEARAVGEKLLALDPNLRVSQFKARSIQPLEVRDRLAENLLAAGIPN
jgi:adenylate cyclase